METRRQFLKKAAFLSGSALLWTAVPESIQKALAIDPEPGSTFLDAEHVVILMQENRSFDHCYGALRGVRGFGDPRAHVQPNGNPVWFQTDAKGETYAPFRLDIKRTNATWIGGLPHSWTDQVDARNGGRYDKWLIAKPRKELPFTLGHYTREDLPFYYALADAFTICDQAFCSSLTGTTPNRLFLWSGTIRKDPADFARVNNSDTDYDAEAAWTTFPERLEDHGISWRVYQNEISLDSGFRGEQDAWLSNFTDNPLEWFTQYRVRHAKGRRAHHDRLAETLPDEIAALEKNPGDGKKLDEKRAQLQAVEAERAAHTQASWNALSARERALHEKAFCTNEGDPDYRELTTLKYHDGETEREVQVPKGDTLYRFRKDVEEGKLPAVSWIVAPENFSDHPGAAWYGAWYVSEVLDILTKNPEVWKKTIFVLCYDENDGYFDHVPPFVAPHPGKPETGKTSAGLDTAPDVVTMESELTRKPAHAARECSIGLGYRVPLVIASPWSRGGAVNSQVFDHTSVLQLLETWLSHRTGKPIQEENISDWRRTVCGDLSSTFRPYHGEKIELPTPLDRDRTVEDIHQARFRTQPVGGKALSPEEIAAYRPVQETGTRPSCPLPYELVVDGVREGDTLKVVMEARNNAFGQKAQGAPFNAYAYGDEMKVRAYAVRAGDSVTDTWPVGDAYHVRVDGPNGFMREFRGSRSEVPVEVKVGYAGGKNPNGVVQVRVTNRDTQAHTVEVRDRSYGAAAQKRTVTPGSTTVLNVDARKSGGWYDLEVGVGGDEAFSRRYAGRVETGAWTTSDPAMAR